MSAPPLSVQTMVVVGVGSDYRGDDGVGPAVAAELADLESAGVRVLVRDQEPTRLMEAWQGTALALVVDASSPQGQPGRVRRFDVSAEPLPAEGSGPSTHAVGLGDVVELSRALGSLPARVVVYAVEARDFSFGAPLSEAVAAAVPVVAAAVRAELGLAQLAERANAHLSREERGCTSAA